LAKPSHRLSHLPYPPLHSTDLRPPLPTNAVISGITPRTVISFAGEEKAASFRRGSAVIAGIVSTNRERAFNRKRTRLNSSQVAISYAVFCLKKKKKKKKKLKIK